MDAFFFKCRNRSRPEETLGNGDIAPLLQSHDVFSSFKLALPRCSRLAMSRRLLGHSFDPLHLLERLPAIDLHKCSNETKLAHQLRAGALPPEIPALFPKGISR